MPFKLKQWLFLSISGLIISVILLVNIFSYKAFEKEMLQKIGDSRVDVLNQVSEKAQITKRTAVIAANMISSSPFLQEGLLADSTDPQTNERLFRELDLIQDYHHKISQATNIFFHTTILSNNGFRYTSGHTVSNKIESSLWYRKIMQSNMDSFWTGGINDFSDEQNQVIAYIRTLFPPDRTTPYAAILISINEGYLYDSYKSVLGENNTIYVLDENGKIISHPDKGMLGANFYNMERFYSLITGSNYTVINKMNKDVLLSYYTDPETNWTIVEEIHLDVLLAPLNQIRLFIAAISLMVSIAALCLTSYFSKKAADPIMKLCNLMEQVDENNLDVTFQEGSWYEIDLLGRNFNKMLERIKMLLEDIKQKEHLKNRAEINFLQAQINPHFIHNTLFSVKCLLEMGKIDRSEKMLGAFLGFLQHVLGGKDTFSTLKEETEFIRQYILIQQFMCGDKIHFHADIPDELRSQRIPKMLLQPVVENSILHGFSASDQDHSIRIRVEAQDAFLVLTVQDNGIGIAPEQLDQLFTERKKDGKRNSIGLANVKQRLQILFDGHYSITAVSDTGSGTAVTITIPQNG